MVLQLEKMKLLEQSNLEQGEFMDQIRKKQIEEYEQLLEENRKLQLEINKLTREKEGLGGRLEIASQQLIELQEKKKQFVEIENKLNSRELDVFKLKQKESELQMKIEELIQANKKLQSGAQLTLRQTDEFAQKVQMTEHNLREATEYRQKYEHQLQEMQNKMNQQQSYVNKVLEQLANLQQENAQLQDQVVQYDTNQTRFENEMRSQQGYTMELVEKLKSCENERLILQDKIEKQERLVRVLQEKLDHQEYKRNEINEIARDNTELVKRLEEISSILESKNYELAKMSKKIQIIEQQFGVDSQEIPQMIKSKEEEIYKVLKMNKQLVDRKKKYKELVQEKEQDIANLKDKILIMQREYSEKEGEFKSKFDQTNQFQSKYEELKAEFIDLQGKVKKMYEDNQILFNENQELKKALLHQQQKYDSGSIAILQENKDLKQQIMSEREQNQQIVLKLQQQWRDEKMQIQLMQEQFKMNGDKYTAQIRELEATLFKMRNETLLTQVQGKVSFENLYKDFIAMQKQNKLLYDQLNQYDSRFEQMHLMQEKVINDQIPNQYIHYKQAHPLMPLSTNNLQVAEIPYIKKNPGYKTTNYNEIQQDEGINQKIYSRCREIVTNYD